MAKPWPFGRESHKSSTPERALEIRLWLDLFSCKSAVCERFHNGAACINKESRQSVAFAGHLCGPGDKNESNMAAASRVGRLIYAQHLMTHTFEIAFENVIPSSRNLEFEVNLPVFSGSVSLV